MTKHLTIRTAHSSRMCGWGIGNHDEEHDTRPDRTNSFWFQSHPCYCSRGTWQRKDDDSQPEPDQILTAAVFALERVDNHATADATTGEEYLK